jgi:hypothetical protein
MTWALAHSLIRLVLTVIVVVKITRFRDTLNRVERFGLGVMGGCGILTLNVIWERQQSPYDGWATTLFSFGAILFLAGRTYRDWKHQRANDLQVEYWERHKRERGIS